MGLFGPPDVQKMEANKDIKGLIKALSYQKDWRVRRDSARVLGDFADALALEPLIAALDDEHNEVRELIAKALGNIGDARAVGPLIAAFTDESCSEGVRSSAAEALGQIGDARTVEPLIAAFTDESYSEGVRSSAAEALGEIGDTRVVELLIAAFTDESYSEGVRSSAAKALGEIGDARAVEPLTVFFREARFHKDLILSCATKALVQIGAPAVERLIAEYKRAIVQNDIYILDRVENCLVQIGEPAASPLSILLDDPNSQIQGLAARMLGKIGSQQVVEPLIASLNDQTRTTSDLNEVAEALGKIGDPRAIPYLITFLKDRQSKSAAVSLEQIGWEPGEDEASAWYWVVKGNYMNAKALGKAATEPLIYATRKGVLSALEGLIELGISVEEILLDLFKNGKGNIRFFAIEALVEQVGWNLEQEEINAWYRVAKEEYERATDLGPVAIEPLIEALDIYVGGNRKVVPALAKMGKAAVEPLIAALNAESQRGLSLVVETLGIIGDTRAVDALINLLQKNDVNVATEAAEALQQIGDPRAIRPVAALLKTIEDKESFQYKRISRSLEALQKLSTHMDDGTMTDARSGLLWQQAEDGVERTYEDALTYCRSLRLAGYDDWRMPTKEELQNLASVSPADLKKDFPDIKMGRYWAHTTISELSWAEAPERIAYTVDFDPESGNYRKPTTYFKTYSYYVRAVRDMTG